MTSHAQYSALSSATANDQGSHSLSVQARDSSSDPISSPVHLSRSSSRQPSRQSSPFVPIASSSKQGQTNQGKATSGNHRGSFSDNESDGSPRLEDFEDPIAPKGMPSDLRPPYHRPIDGKSHTPLLSRPKENGQPSPISPTSHRRRSSTFSFRQASTFRQRDPQEDSKSATKRRYIYASFFFAVSLVSFTVQTETAVYIQKFLGWQKAYAMLYATHGSWTMLWFLQLLILRLQKWSMPWNVFWQRHVNLLRSTAQMVEHHDIQAPEKYPDRSPVRYMLKTTAFVTCALTIAGGSWYVAVDLTTASDLTAIYNCSAFFAYVFSIPLLNEKFRWSKAIAVGIAIFGVLVVAYGDSTVPKHGSHSGGGTGGKDPEDGSADSAEASNRALGNIIIGIGSVLYGFYEVLYKRYACPPDETSPGRSMIFANMFGSCIGTFTLTVLWIPLPILHYTGIEEFVWPTGEAAWMLAISVFANAIFSGSFLVLMSLTSPVLSSVAALLTIFIVALVDQLLPPPLNNPLSGAALIGGVLIIGAFLLLAWATYQEMDEERKKKKIEEVDDSESDDDV